MGAKNVVVLKTHFGSFNTNLVNDFVCGNMLWAFGSLRVFLCNCMLCFFGVIIRCISRFLHLGDAKNELDVQPLQADSDVNGFSEELGSFLFWSEDVYEGGGERDRETESSVFMEDSEKRYGETECSVLMEVKTESSVFEEVEPEVCEEDGAKIGTEEEEEDESDFVESGFFSIDEDCKKDGGDVEEFMFMEIIDSDPHDYDKKIDENETESSVSKKNISGILRDSNSVHTDSNYHEDAKKIDENEAETSVFVENEPNVHEEEEETEDSVFVETNTNKCQSNNMSGKDSIISGFIEEPTAMSFSFREFYMGPHVSSVSSIACSDYAEIIAGEKFSARDSEDSLPQEEIEDSVPQENTKDSVPREGIEDSVPQENTEDSVLQVSVPSTPDIPFRFEIGAFGGTDSSGDNEDDFVFNENSLVSDSESESSCSSGLIWGNNNNIVDDKIEYRFFGRNSGAGEGFESEILKLIMKEERIDEAETQFSSDEYIEMEPGKKDWRSFNARGFRGGDCAKAADNDIKEGGKLEEKTRRNGGKETEEARWEEVSSKSSESGSDEQDEDDSFEWEHDDLVEQLKLELKNARQGGLATIFEEEEDENDDNNGEEYEEKLVIESPKIVEDLESLKIEEKLEYKDQVDEIEKIYKSYAEKMRKLDILNYQTMHASGLIQLKDPLKSISIPKSTTLGAKPVISQNLWPRKAPKNAIDPLEKFVRELHRDLELVYVGQVCLSWEILCWQHEKARELQRYDSQEESPRRYNVVAGEFQLFRVLMQRFIENEPFQGPRVQNYVKNRCVIRNLLQVPVIKDDSMKDGNMSKGDEEDPIASGRLADMIKECMRVYWEFVRADKDYGNVILKVSQQIGTDLKDPVISGLLEDIRTQLHKKEKRLKDIVRSGNCIVKKFQKHHEDQLDHEQLVAQVGLRLISRVLNMSKLTREQVIWCNQKLHRIKFLSRKIVEVEPSFMLFPC